MSSTFFISWNSKWILLLFYCCISLKKLFIASQNKKKNNENSRTQIWFIWKHICMIIIVWIVCPIRTAPQGMTGLLWVVLPPTGCTLVVIKPLVKIHSAKASSGRSQDRPIIFSLKRTHSDRDKVIVKKMFIHGLSVR